MAKKFLDDMELGSDSIRAAVIEFMPYSFSAVETQAKKFYEVSVLHACLQLGWALARSAR